MAKAEEIVFAALSADADLCNLVGGLGNSARIYPDHMPEDCADDAVIYGLTGSERHRTLCAYTGYATAQVQIVAAANTYSGAHAIADAARSAMLGIDNCEVGSDNDDHVDDRELHLVTTNYSIFHAEG